MSDCSHKCETRYGDDLKTRPNVLPKKKKLNLKLINMVTMRNLVCLSAILITKIRVLVTVIWKIGYRIIVIISTTTAAADVYSFYHLI
jgi:hypothetical protein